MKTPRNPGVLRDASRRHGRVDWLSLSTFLPVIALGMLGGLGGNFAEVTYLLFTPLCLLVGIRVLARNPKLYIVYAYSLWFFTPLVRRLVDWGTSYHPTSLILLAPPAVTMLAIFPVIMRRTSVPGAEQALYGTITVILAAAWGVGTLNHGLFPATAGLISWFAPIIFAIFIRIREREGCHDGPLLLRIIVLGGILISLYGIYQYYFLPEWDANWIRASRFTSAGIPEPLGVRVFGPMNSPGPYAATLMSCLIAAVAAPNLIRYVAPPLIIGALAFTLTRSAWGSAAVGLAVLTVFSPLRAKVNIVLLALLIASGLLALVPLAPGTERVLARADTVQALEHDYSFNERLRMYSEFGGAAADALIGVGFGGTGVATAFATGTHRGLRDLDSGLVDTLFTFGVLGSLVFSGCLALLLIRGLRSPKSAAKPAILGITAAVLSLSFFGNSIVGVGGMFFYPLLAATVLKQRRRVKVEDTVVARTRQGDLRPGLSRPPTAPPHALPRHDAPGLDELSSRRGST